MNGLKRNCAESSGLNRQRTVAAALVCAALLMACGTNPQIGNRKVDANPRSESAIAKRETAMAMWRARCGGSGEQIRRTVHGVDGIFLVNVRARKNFGESSEDQFSLDDPYGDDLLGDAYINTFLRDSFRFHYSESGVPKGWPSHFGYKFVEAIDPRNGRLYRYTGKITEPWQDDKNYPKGYLKFSLERTPIAVRSARYGIKYEDISTRDEREHWIAGSSLKVIDLESQEVVAERIGYMIDPAQGDRRGGRSPWLFAAEYACPEFARDLPEAARLQSPKSRYQPRQTQRFVEKVLTPTP